MRRVGVAACLTLLVLTSCSGKNTSTKTAAPTQSSAATPPATPCALAGADTAMKKSENQPPSSPVTDVRWKKDGCPSVVFQFKDQTAGYTVKYAQPPFSDCGPGTDIATASWGAKAFLEVRLEPSASVDLMHDAKPTYSGPRDITVDGDVLKHLKVICDFEGVFDWIVGLDVKHPFNVTTFEDAPPRLVIDISQS